jgi:hypothetical protein
VLNVTPALQRRRAAPAEAWAVWPRRGRHLAFDGALLHAVSAELAAGRGESEGEVVGPHRV